MPPPPKKKEKDQKDEQKYREHKKKSKGLAVRTPLKCMNIKLNANTADHIITNFGMHLYIL